MSIPKLPSIPTVPTDSEVELAVFLNSVKTVLDSIRNPDGSYGSSQAEINGLAQQVYTANATGGSSSNTVPPANIDPAFPPTAIPPALTGLTVSPGFSTIILAWDTLPYGYSAYTNIYRAAVDDFSLATVVGTSIALIYADYVPNSTTYYYWITSVSDFGVEGPPNASAGTAAVVSFDPAYTLAVLDAAITATQIVGGTLTRDQLSTGTWGNDVYSQPTPPTAPLEIDDVWFDTDDGNKMYLWDGTIWVQHRDTGIAAALLNAANAQATADGKIVTFFQAAPPTAEGVGDLWVDTDAGNELFRWNGTAWASSKDAGITAALTNAANAQAAADGKIVTFFQDAPPTATSIGDLWVDTDAGNELFRWNGTAWVSSQDNAISTAITSAATAQATADGKITTFFQTATPTAESVGDLWYSSSTELLQRWTGTVWEVSSNNYTDTLKLTDGAGLGNTAVWASVSGTGKPADNATVGATLGTNVGGQINAANIATLMAAEAIPTSRIQLAAITTALIGTGVIVEAHIGTAVILDAFIQSLGADQISVTQLAAFTANLGTVTAGVIKSPDNTMVIDLDSKSILMTGPAGQAADDYTIIQNGVIKSYTWNGSVSTLSKSLRGIISGTAANGTTVVMNGQAFSTQPFVTITPRDILVYDQAQSSVSQRLQIRADNIQETSAGSTIWQFDAVAELVSDGGSDTQLINQTVGPNATATHTTSVYTTTANVTAISVNLSLQSYKGSTSDENYFYYFYRKAVVTLYYRVAGGTTYTATAAQTVALGATRGEVLTDLLFSGLPAQAHNIYISIAYSNVNTTTFTEASGGYDYASSTVTPANITANVVATTAEWSNGGTDPNGSTLTDYRALPVTAAPPAGYVVGDIYNVVYNWLVDWDFSVTLYATTTGSSAGVAYRNSDAAGTAESGSINAAASPRSGSDINRARTVTTAVYETSKASFCKAYAKATGQGASVSWGGTADVTTTTKSITVQHDYRKFKTLDTTAVNKVVFNSYLATVVGGSTISTGTLNWQAIGE